MEKVSLPKFHSGLLLIKLLALLHKAFLHPPPLHHSRFWVHLYLGQGFRYIQHSQSWLWFLLKHISLLFSGTTTLYAFWAWRSSGIQAELPLFFLYQQVEVRAFVISTQSPSFCSWELLYSKSKQILVLHAFKIISTLRCQARAVKCLIFLMTIGHQSFL